MFSNRGDIKVKIKFESKRDKGRKLRDFNAEWPEILSLFDSQTKLPHFSIYCDDYLCEISKIEMDLKKRLVIITIGETDLPELPSGALSV